MFLKEEDGIDADRDGDPSDDDDGLTEAVLRLQKQHFKFDDDNNNNEFDATNDEDVCEDVETRKDELKRNIVLPTVSEAFANVATEFTKKSDVSEMVQQSTSLDRVVAGRSHPSAQSEPAVSSATTLGLPDEGFWHVPLTFIDVSMTYDDLMIKYNSMIISLESLGYGISSYICILL